MTPSIESQLLTESIGQLDLSRYCIVTLDSTVRETVERMQVLRQNCAFVVGKGTHLVGLLTDRDVLRKVANRPEVWDKPVDTVMTKSPDTLPPSATAGEALRMMDERHYRNIPVVDQHGTLRGNVTHFAIMKYLADHFPQAIYNLPPNLAQIAKHRDGG